LPTIAGFCLSAALACEPCEPEPGAPGVDLDGVLLYEYSTGEPSDTVGIQLVSGGAIQLAGASQVHATLTPAALELLNTTSDQVAAGMELGAFDPQCLGFLDSPRARLRLPVAHGTLDFGYPGGCPPASLVALDLMLRDLVLALPECDPSPSLQDCTVAESTG